MPATSVIEPPPVPRGLKGVQVADTAIGDVRGLEGFYHYRQYNAVEIAERLTFEDAWHLLIEGELPTPEQRDRFAAEVAGLRTLPDPVRARAAGDRRRRRARLPGGPAQRAVGARGSRAVPAEPRRDPGRAPPRRPADERRDADRQRRPVPAGPGRGADRAAIRPGPLRQLPLHAHGRGGGSRARPRDRGVHDLDHRARLQRLDVHGARRDVDRRRRRLGRRGRARIAVGPAPRWRSQPRPRHAGRDRHARPGRRLDPRSRLERAADHGLRPPGLQDRRPAFGAAPADREGDRRSAGRVRRAGRADHARHPRRAEARPAHPHERRVLRGRRDGAVAASRASCSRPRSPPAASSAGAPTSSNRPPTTASSGPAPATSARPRRRRCRTTAWARAPRRPRSRSPPARSRTPRGRPRTRPTAAGARRRRSPSAGSSG